MKELKAKINDYEIRKEKKSEVNENILKPILTE